jgi:hypothetical protein
MEQNIFGNSTCLRHTFKWPESLWWLVPVSIGALIEIAFLVPFINADGLNRHREILVILVPFCFIAPVGGWWAIYQCIRNEQHPARYIAVVVLVPLGFIWYYFERYRYRDAQS